MDFLRILADDFTVQDLADFIDKVKEVYQSFGIIAAIGLPFFETLFPVLPLFLMIAFNILSYGIFFGYIFTYIGTTVGTIVIFVFMRYVSTKHFRENNKRKFKIKLYLDWIENTHPILHILVLMIPFNPSFVINYSMGLSKMRLSTFIVITTISRAIMLVICIPFGITLINLYESGELGGVEIMWLAFTGVTLLAGIIVGQLFTRRVHKRKLTE